MSSSRNLRFSSGLLAFWYGYGPDRLVLIPVSFWVTVIACHTLLMVLEGFAVSPLCAVGRVLP